MNGRAREISLWVALAVAFSPTIVQLGQSLEAGRIPSTLLLGPLLILLCLLQGVGRRGNRRRPAGVVLALSAAVLQLIGIQGGGWSIARFGLPLAVLGMALFLARPVPIVVVLALGVFPLPDFVVNFFSPGIERVQVAAACEVWQRLGVEFECTPPVVTSVWGRFELRGVTAGLPLAGVLAQLGWYRAVVRSAGWAGAFRSGFLFAASVVLIQPLGVAFALLLLALGLEGGAELWIEHLLWMTCAAVVLLGSARDLRAGGRWGEA